MRKSVNYIIVPIAKEYIESFWAAVDSVARERKYLAFLEGPPIESTCEFDLKNIQGNRPHFVALDNDKVVGWCDIASLEGPVFAHSGILGIGILAEYIPISLQDANIGE